MRWHRANGAPGAKEDPLEPGPGEGSPPALTDTESRYMVDSVNKAGPRCANTRPPAPGSVGTGARRRGTVSPARPSNERSR
jgi:hypothetical protein